MVESQWATISDLILRIYGVTDDSDRCEGVNLRVNIKRDYFCNWSDLMSVRISSVYMSRPHPTRMGLW